MGGEDRPVLSLEDGKLRNSNGKGWIHFLGRATWGSEQAEAVAFLYSPAHYGDLAPLDAEAYTRLSIRYCSSEEGSIALFYEQTQPTPSPNPAPPEFPIQLQQGCHIVVADMSSAPGWEGSIGKVGMHFYTPVDIDWVRLTRPGSATTCDISLSTVDWGGADGDIEVLVAGNEAGDHGTKIGMAADNDVFNWGGGDTELPLPQDLDPGSYRVVLTRGGVVHELPTPVVVGAVPLPVWRSPSWTSGRDYAETELGNPWDFDDTGTDASLSSPVGNKLTFLGGELHGQVWAENGLDNVATDVSLNVPDDHPIDTSYYRYLSFDHMQEDLTLVRLILWNDWTVGGNLHGTTETVVHEYPGLWYRYQWDLSKLCSATAPAEGCQGLLRDHEAQSAGWRDKSWTSFSWRPAEMWYSEGYHSEATAYDWHVRRVYLTGPPEAHGEYELELDIWNPESELLGVAVYYDDDDRGFDGQPIVSKIIDRRSFSHKWDTNAVPAGEYSIYACVNDGSAEQCRYSPVVIRVSHPSN